MTAPLTLRLDTPADLVAALPVLLRFHPADSLVLIALGGASGGRIGLTVRLDLPRAGLAGRALAPPGTVGAVAGVAQAAVEALLHDTPSEAAVIVVSAGGAGPHRGLVDRVVDGLAARSVAARTVLWAEATTGGARWRCFGACGCSGTVPDPGSSAAMAAGVFAGRIVARSRDDLRRRLASTDPAALRRRDRLLAGRAEAPRRQDPADLALGAVGARLARLDAAVAASAAGTLVLDDEQVVDLAVTLGLPEGREAAARHCLGEAAGAAEELWAALARETPDPEAAEPATLLALSALLAGEGALAAVALDRAEAAWPGHRFARLLRGAHDARLRPSELRAALATDDHVLA